MKRIDDELWVAFGIAAIVVLWPQPTATLEAPCALSPSQQDVRRGTLRENASRFAPTVEVRLWLQPADRREDRQRAVPAAVFVAPEPDIESDRPDRSKFETDRTFGWQIQFQWDVLRMLQTARPASFDLAGRLESTRCRTLRQRANEKIDEIWRHAPSDEDHIGGAR